MDRNLTTAVFLCVQFVFHHFCSTLFQKVYFISIVLLASFHPLLSMWQVLFIFHYFALLDVQSISSLMFSIQNYISFLYHLLCFLLLISVGLYVCVVFFFHFMDQVSDFVAIGYDWYYTHIEDFSFRHLFRKYC